MEQNRVRHEISRFIRDSRVDRGFSQEQVHENTRIPLQTLRNWEEGLESPTALLFLDWMSFFGHEEMLKASLLLSRLTTESRSSNKLP